MAKGNSSEHANKNDVEKCEKADGENASSPIQRASTEEKPVANEVSGSPDDVKLSVDAAGEKVEHEKKKKKKKAQADETNNRVSSRKSEFAGLIFMCNSSTKQDCFRYRVFGLPSGKKDIVEKVYPGMKLFLFDFDLRLMYGIYKASSRGGDEIEPNAFRGSQRSFPAQVRFRIHEDCLPLSEDIFKNAIKDNYDGRNKFKFELNAQQVKNLCKLFRPVTLNSQSAHDNVHRRPARSLEYGVVSDDIILAREERLRREYESRNSYSLEDTRRAAYDDYIPRLPLRVYNSEPVISEREIGYGSGRGIAPYTDYIPKPPLPAYNIDNARSEREMLMYGVENDRVPIVTADPYAVDKGPDSYGAIYQRQLLAPRDPLAARNGLISDLKYQDRDPLFDSVYQQRIEAEARQRLMEDTYLDEIKRPYATGQPHYGDQHLYRDPLPIVDLAPSVGAPSVDSLVYPSTIGLSSLYR